MWACISVCLVSYILVTYFVCQQFQDWQEVSFLQPFFAFSYKERFDVNGWDIYDPEKEFQRQVFK